MFMLIYGLELWWFKIVIFTYIKIKVITNRKNLLCNCVNLLNCVLPPCELKFKNKMHMDKGPITRVKFCNTSSQSTKFSAIFIIKIGYHTNKGFSVFDDKWMDAYHVILHVTLVFS